jgi:dephospho-CoA kinase
MMIVGLTGGIGSGKTTVAKIFKDFGVPVYNSDKEAKRLMKSSKKIRKAVRELLGDDAYADKKLNRAFIANRVFQDKSLLHKLNAIVHPAVREDFTFWAKKQESAYVIQETAIIFENSMQSFYDRIILVTAPEEIRLKRILARDNGSKSKVLDRMQNQRKDSEKIPLSDFVIDNVELDQTYLKVQEVNKCLLEYSGR